MARSYINQETLDIDFIKPARMSFDIRGATQSGGVNLLGETISIGSVGGGRVVGSYQDCWVQAPEEHEYLNHLAGLLYGATGFINVPIKNDWIGPFPTFDRWPEPIITGIPHSDGSLFSDGSGYSQATVYGEAVGTTALHAGIIEMRVIGNARPLRLSDWFSIYHGAKMGWRAYRYWKVLSVTSETSPVYRLAFAPALRAAVPNGTRVEFARPRFVGQLARGTSIPWDVEGFWQSRPTLAFVEAY